MQQLPSLQLKTTIFALWFIVSIYCQAESLRFGSDIMLEVFLVPQRGEYNCEKLPENAMMIGREKADQIHDLKGMIFNSANKNLLSKQSMIFARAIDPHSRIVQAIACDDQLNSDSREFHLYLKPLRSNNGI